jgi:hypothetical protein
MLSEVDAEADYEAVMETADRLRAGAPNGWPRRGFTLEENRDDLIRHEREFFDGVAFAYTMVDPDDRCVLGCVYFNPSTVTDVDVHMWVRDSHAETLTRPLYDTVRQWLSDAWPFENINWVRTGYYLPEGGTAPGERS